MPLLPGKENIGHNVREMEAAGHKPSQAVAAALRTAYGPPKKRANGGHVGPLPGATGGRADAIKTTVPDGSHVIPADIVSYLGGYNNAAGLALLDKHFPHRAEGGGISTPGMHETSIPGTPHITMPHLAGLPHPHVTAPSHLAGIPKVMGIGSLPHMTKLKMANGGEPQPVPVRLSDGEWVFSPEWVKRFGGGDPEKGHRELDKWIVATRKESIKRQQKLPGPAKD